jgi:hypothetical protein
VCNTFGEKITSEANFEAAMNMGEFGIIGNPNSQSNSNANSS